MSELATRQTEFMDIGWGDARCIWCLAAHLRAIAHQQAAFPSAVIGWQLLRSMFEYVATYAWIAADPTTRSGQWLKSDYAQRLKLDNDFRELGETFLDEVERERVKDFLPEMDGLSARSTAAAAVTCWQLCVFAALAAGVLSPARVEPPV